MSQDTVLVHERLAIVGVGESNFRATAGRRTDSVRPQIPVLNPWSMKTVALS